MIASFEFDTANTIALIFGIVCLMAALVMFAYTNPKRALGFPALGIAAAGALMVFVSVAQASDDSRTTQVWRELVRQHYEVSRQDIVVENDEVHQVYIHSDRHPVCGLMFRLTDDSPVRVIRETDERRLSRQQVMRIVEANCAP